MTEQLVIDRDGQLVRRHPEGFIRGATYIIPFHLGLMRHDGLDFSRKHEGGRIEFEPVKGTGGAVWFEVRRKYETWYHNPWTGETWGREPWPNPEDYAGKLPWRA